MNSFRAEKYLPNNFTLEFQGFLEFPHSFPLLSFILPHSISQDFVCRSFFKFSCEADFGVRLLFVWLRFCCLFASGFLFVLFSF